MVQDSPSFQSQQYVQGIQEQSANRQERYVDRYAQSRQQIAEVPMRFMQARGMAMEQQRMQQEQQMRLSKVASDLANDQLHRQQALEDLQWSQQLHQADMIGLQKRGMAAEIALKEAQTKKAIDELGGERIPYAMLTQERMDYAISKLGIMADPSSNMRVRAATKEERAAAEQRENDRLQRTQQDELEQIRTRNEGRGLADPSLAEQRGAAADLAKQSALSKKAGLLMDRIEALGSEIMTKEYRAKNEQDSGTKAMLEQELTDLRRRHKAMSDQLDAEITGSGTQTADDQTTIEEDLGRAGSVLERFMGGSK